MHDSQSLFERGYSPSYPRIDVSKYDIVEESVSFDSNSTLKRPETGPTNNFAFIRYSSPRTCGMSVQNLNGFTIAAIWFVPNQLSMATCLCHRIGNLVPCLHDHCILLSVHKRKKKQGKLKKSNMLMFIEHLQAKLFQAHLQCLRASWHVWCLECAVEMYFWVIEIVLNRNAIVVSLVTRVHCVHINGAI